MIFHDDSRELEGNTWSKRNPRREISRNFPIDNPSSMMIMIFHGDDDSRELEGNMCKKNRRTTEGKSCEIFPSITHYSATML